MKAFGFSSIVLTLLFCGCDTQPTTTLTTGEIDTQVRAELNGNVNANINVDADINIVADVTCHIECNLNDGSDCETVCEILQGPPPTLAYVGSDTCASCHPSHYENFVLTGHPFKLNEVVAGQPPVYPVTTLSDPPAGLLWDAVSYVIGGFRWKYRVMDLDGYVVLGPTAQYNLLTQAWSAYNNDSNHTALDGTPGPWVQNIGRKSYNCASCHTTGYDPGAASHLGLDGVVGDWAFEGVQCEACHGPGSSHAAGPSPSNIDGSPDTTTVCGRCHTRSSTGIAAKGGFVRHHEQYDEFSRTKHAQVMSGGCMTCHDTHQPLFDSAKLQAFQNADSHPEEVEDLPVAAGIRMQCTSCHAGVSVDHEGPTDCKACHMAFTGKSAQSFNANMGDVRSHAWRINDDPSALMFTDANGAGVSRDDPSVAFAALDNGRPFITLDFACLRCHIEKDMDWASNHADDIH
ncbi:MAG: hypothetical protein GXP29_00310 [Planctomycetes bacterium]|nr:hypothetical protein [Planctomycetota bacterium]